MRAQRLVVRISAIATEALVDDGFGGRTVRAVRPLAKGGWGPGIVSAASQRKITTGLTERPGTRVEGDRGEVLRCVFTCGVYEFEFRKGTSGVPLLTVTGGKLPMPFHMVVGGYNDAQKRAPTVCETFDKGGVPEEGLYRRIGESVTVKWPGRFRA